MYPDSLPIEYALPLAVVLWCWWISIKIKDRRTR